MADDLVVNKRELARAVGVSEPTVDRWLRDGCPTVRGGDRGVAYEFSIAAVLAWRRAVEARAASDAQQHLDALHQLELQITGGTVADGEIARLGAKDRVVALDAEMRAMKLAKEKGQLLDRVAVQRDYAAVFAFFRQRLLGMPTYLTRTGQLPFAVSKAMEAEMRNLLRDLAKQISDPDLRPADPSAAGPGADVLQLDGEGAR